MDLEHIVGRPLHFSNKRKYALDKLLEDRAIFHSPRSIMFYMCRQPEMRLVAISLMLGTVLAQSRQAMPRPEAKQDELTDAQMKQLLLLMDTDKNGKISKQEWMNFMSAEFDRLDKDKSGELDPKELWLSNLQESTFARVGK